MELELHLSRKAQRERFAAGEPEGLEVVRVNVEGLELEPHTRALLFDTFGPGTVRIPPELLRFDRVPKRDWDFWLLAYRYRAARARKRWGRRFSVVAWIGVGVVLIAILSSPLVSPTVKFLVAMTVFLTILIFGFLVS
jgi:hypothetical protein